MQLDIYFAALIGVVFLLFILPYILRYPVGSGWYSAYLLEFIKNTQPVRQLTLEEHQKLQPFLNKHKLTLRSHCVYELCGHLQEHSTRSKKRSIVIGRPRVVYTINNIEVVFPPSFLPPHLLMQKNAVNKTLVVCLESFALIIESNGLSTLTPS